MFNSGPWACSSPRQRQALNVLFPPEPPIHLSQAPATGPDAWGLESPLPLCAPPAPAVEVSPGANFPLQTDTPS